MGKQPSKPTKNGVAEDRNRNGTFAPGNPGGPGRPRRAIELDYVRQIGRAISPKRFRQMLRAVATAAEAGDMKAAGLIVSLLLGKSECRPTMVDLAALEAGGYETKVAEEIEAARMRHFMKVVANHFAANQNIKKDPNNDE